MTGTALTATNTSDLELYSGNTGKSRRLTWWNSYQSRWDGLLPKDDGGSDDHYIFTGIDGTPVDTGIQLEDRSTGQPTIYWDDANKKLHCVSAHDSSFQYWTIDYNSTTDIYSFVSGQGVDGTGVTVSGLTRGSAKRDEGFGLTKTPNGYLWVFNCQNASNQIQMAYSTDSGATWSTEITLGTLSDRACVDATWFANGGTNYVCVFVSENGNGGSAGREQRFYYIDEGNASPTTSGNWTNDSANIPAFDTSAEADDHCCMAKDSSENLYIVYKQEGTGENDIKLITRSPTGTWGGTYEVWNDTAGRTRPVVGIKKKDSSTDEELIVAASLTYAPRGTIVYKTTDLTTISFSAETTLFEDTVGSDDLNDTIIYQSDFVATSDSGVFAIAHDETDTDYWQNSVSITASAGVTLDAVDIESASEVTNPAIGQIHALTAIDIDSASNVSQPVIAQIHALTNVSVDSSSEVTQPNISQSHILAATSIESASNVSNPAVTDVSGTVLDAVDIESASEVSSPTFAQVHLLNPTGAESASVVSTPVIGQIYLLHPVSVDSSSTVSSPTLNGTPIVTPSSRVISVIGDSRLISIGQANRSIVVNPQTRDIMVN